MLSNIKTFVKNTPVIGSFLFHLRFKNSSNYWDRRYRSGGTSGVGSYNRLAEFKASFLNRFVDQHQTTSVIEYGCGDGAQLRLALYPSYTGVDVSAKAVERCRLLFAEDKTKRFLRSDAAVSGPKAELSLSLDVIYHLVEDPVYDAYMRQLFESAQRFVIVYSSNRDQSRPRGHVRHREFTRWVEQNKPEWHLLSTLKNAYPYDAADPERTSFADFYVFARR
jgi:SAM-dependent methyltransferase